MSLTKTKKKGLELKTGLVKEVSDIFTNSSVASHNLSFCFNAFPLLVFMPFATFIAYI